MTTQKFKCSNCKRESEIENKGEKVIIVVLCKCGYYMEEI